MTAARLAIALPMKPLHAAKTRLAGALAPEQRRALAHTLLVRTLRFFATHYAQHDRVIVTPCRTVGRLAQRLGARVLLEPDLGGLNAAAERARDWASQRGYDQLLLVPGDIPVWTCADVDHVLTQGLTNDVVVARARDGGTNALLTRLPTPLTSHYGPDSAAAHQRAAQAAGLRVAVCQPPFLAYDLDTPQDLLLQAQRAPALELVP